MTAWSRDVLVLHIPKCGGHSCRELLAATVRGGVEDLARIYARPPHLALRDVEAWTGRAPDSFRRILAVVRNPYDHQRSQWMYWRDMAARGFRGLQFQTAALYPDLVHWLLDPMCDWHVHDPRPTDGITRTVAQGPAGYEEFGGYYRYWLCNADGSWPENLELVRFERMVTDFPAALAKALDYNATAEMPHSNPGPAGEDAMAYYHDPRARQMVERKFRWAFESGLYRRH